MTRWKFPTERSSCIRLGEKVVCLWKAHYIPTFLVSSPVYYLLYTEAQWRTLHVSTHQEILKVLPTGESCPLLGGAWMGSLSAAQHWPGAHRESAPRVSSAGSGGLGRSAEILEEDGYSESTGEKKALSSF